MIIACICCTQTAFVMMACFFFLLVLLILFLLFLSVKFRFVCQKSLNKICSGVFVFSYFLKQLCITIGCFFVFVCV